MGYYDQIVTLINTYCIAHGKTFEIKIAGSCDSTTISEEDTNSLTNTLSLFLDKTLSFTYTNIEYVDYNPFLAINSVYTLRDQEEFLKKAYGELINAGY